MEALATLIGRLHMMVVHFPIAFIILAGVTDLLPARWKTRVPTGVTPLLLLVGAASGVLAVALGLVLAGQESFQGRNADYLEWHRWLGIGTVALALGALGLHHLATKKEDRALRVTYRVTLFLSTLAVIAAGHFGGVLVHGDDYLTEAFAESDDKAGETDTADNRGSGETITKETAAQPATGDEGADLVQNKETGKIDFKTQIEPIFARSCNKKCHNAAKKKGDLRLDKKKYALKGGESGEPSIVPGDRKKSKLFQLISLDPEHEDYMPSKGDPLTADEVELIGKWIDQGAQWP